MTEHTTSALYGVIDRMRNGMPITVEAVDEIARVLRLLQGQGWSGFIPADESLQAIIDGDEKSERIEELERDLANAKKIERLLLDQMQPEPTKRLGYGQHATRHFHTGETDSPHMGRSFAEHDDIPSHTHVAGGRVIFENAS
jgi:hypothetical protein